jgi:IS5 family transposase
MPKRQRTEAELFDEFYRSMMWPVSPKNPLVAELAAIDKLLDESPELIELVRADLDNPSKQPTGRPPEATAEQVLRSAILMQLRGRRYRQLAQEIDAHMLYRKFTRFYHRKIPHFATLNNLIKMISDETWTRLNEAIVRVGIEKQLEDGKSIRHDTSVTETDIAHPVDSRLLENSVRVLCRHMERLLEAAPDLPVEYHNHLRAAKNRAYQIVLTKGADVETKRRPYYEELLALQSATRGYADAALNALETRPDVATRLEAMGETVMLEHWLELADRVYEQAYRRVILGESVPAEEKLVSIFEPHTSIICRGKQGGKAEFGHKFAVATGRSGLITYYEVLEGNPGDNEVLPRALEHHKRVFGRAPERLVADRRYHSAENERVAKMAGVKEVALPKPGRLSELRRKLQAAPWFRRLLKFRAGIEGNLSTLLRSFGLKRCLWQGWHSFKAYIGLGVLTYNLRLLAGHLAHA